MRARELRLMSHKTVYEPRPTTVVTAHLCDVCDKELPSGWELPAGWIKAVRYSGYADDVETYHLCSPQCFAKLAEESRSEYASSPPRAHWECSAARLTDFFGSKQQ